MGVEQQLIDPDDPDYYKQWSEPLRGNWYECDGNPWTDLGPKPPTQDQEPGAREWSPYWAFGAKIVLFAMSVGLGLWFFNYLNVGNNALFLKDEIDTWFASWPGWWKKFIRSVSG